MRMLLALLMVISVLALGSIAPSLGYAGPCNPQIQEC